MSQEERRHDNVEQFHSRQLKRRNFLLTAGLGLGAAAAVSVKALIVETPAAATLDTKPKDKAISHRACAELHRTART